jgi:hypothetical protein
MSTEDYAYSSTVLTAASYASFDDLVWQTSKLYAAFLKSNGWTTIGSSKIAGFSATPDGVDHWNGTTYLAAFSGVDKVWHVLENTLSGNQVCLEVNGGGGNAAFRITFSYNKFNASGVWRNAGSVTYKQRPVDITSTPASGREFGSQYKTDLWPSGSANSRIFFWTRFDGLALGIANRYAATANTSTAGGMLWINKLTHQPETDTNPFVMLHNTNGGAGFGGTNYLQTTPTTNERVVGRIDTSIVFFSTVSVSELSGDVMDFIVADPFTSGEIEVPIITWTPTSPKYVRMSIRDLYRVRAGLSYGLTFNGLDRIVIGNFSFPWDTLTQINSGADVVSTVTPLTAFTSGISGSIPKSFNLGLEKI